MKKLLLTLPFAALPWLMAGCEESVEKAQQDVEQAHKNAAERVTDTVRDADKVIVDEQRKVEDTAKEEAEKIKQEQRELEDAKRAAEKRNNP